MSPSSDLLLGPAAPASPIPEHNSSRSHSHSHSPLQSRSASPVAVRRRRLSSRAASPQPVTRPTSLYAASPRPDLSAAAALNEGALFERDVEHAQEHLLSGSEAIDLAAAPVLSEVATAVHDDVPIDTSAAIAVGHSLSLSHSLGIAGSGTHAPAGAAPPASIASALETAFAPSRSQPSSVSSPSPLASSTPAAATNPGSAGLFTPERMGRSASSTSGMAVPQSDLSPPPSLSLSPSAAGSPVCSTPGSPVTSMHGVHHAQSLPIDRVIKEHTAEDSVIKRRLSFVSYADIINAERAAGTDAHSALSSPGPGASAGSGTDSPPVVLRALPAAPAPAGLLTSPSGSSAFVSAAAPDAASGSLAPSDEAVSPGHLQQHAQPPRPKSPSPLGEYGKLGSTETITQARLAAAGGADGKARFDGDHEADVDSQTKEAREGVAPSKSAWDLFGISAALGSAAGALSGIVGGGLDTPAEEKEERLE